MKKLVFYYVLLMFSVNMINKKGITVTNAFQKTLKESNRKPNKIWLHKGSEFYNRSIKLWLEVNAIEMYWLHNEEKPVATLKDLLKP